MEVNIWSNRKLKKRAGWFLVLMVWVGMVTAVILHQTPQKNQLAEVSSKVDIETKKQVEETPEDELEAAESLEVAEVEQQAQKNSKDFFVEYRVERDQARSEQINLLREMINNPNSDKELKAQAQELLLNITNNIEKEMEIESLIRARGYEDGIAFIHDDSVEVVIATQGLERKDAAKIGDIVINTTDIPRQEVTIIEKKPE
ncbi:SpoIIIAH-like family protein [Halanaerobaculum tunisiense]